MFHLLVAFALFLTMSPIRPALSLVDLSPARNQPVRHLSVADERQTETAAAPSEPTAAEAPLPPIRKDASRLGIETASRAVAVIDWDSGHSLFSKNADEPLPIASITKLVTALVVIDLDMDWDQEAEMLPEDRRIGNVPILVPGQKATIRDLFNLSLVSSSNDATAALSRSTGLSPEGFVERMNLVAGRLGMENHNFVEPTGLDSQNTASAHDVARLVKEALSQPEISQAVLSRSYSFSSLDGATHRVNNTDQLLDSFLSRPPYSFLGGKTGFLNEAGYCFAAGAGNGDGNRVVAVVLGAAGREERFTEVKRMIWWAFDAWSWPTAAE